MQPINKLTTELPIILKHLLENKAINTDRSHVLTIPQKQSTLSDNHQELLGTIPKVEPKTSDGLLPSQKNNCENCKECICKSWRSNITTELASLYGLQLDSIKKYLSKKNPETSNLLKIELYQNTGIFVAEDKLNLAVSKANFKYRELVRQLLSLIVTDEELITFKTAENMNKLNANIRIAIIGYLKKDCGITLSAKDFNDIVRRRIVQAVINKKPPEELEKIKKQNIQRAQKSREKRKKLQEDVLRKRKVCGDDDIQRIGEKCIISKFHENNDQTDHDNSLSGSDEESHHSNDHTIFSSVLESKENNKQTDPPERPSTSILDMYWCIPEQSVVPAQKSVDSNVLNPSSSVMNNSPQTSTFNINYSVNNNDLNNQHPAYPPVNYSTNPYYN